jgi:hypothetical protein
MYKGRINVFACVLNHDIGVACPIWKDLLISFSSLETPVTILDRQLESVQEEEL